MKKAITVSLAILTLSACSGNGPISSVTNAISNVGTSLFGRSPEPDVNLPDPNPERTIASRTRAFTTIDGQQFEVVVEAINSIAFVRPVGSVGAYSAQQVEDAVSAVTRCTGHFDQSILTAMGGSVASRKNLAPFGIGTSNDFRNWHVRVSC